MNKSIYCVYEDRWVAESEASREHVIPAALGGVRALGIQVSRSANSRLGSELDGGVANEFFMKQKRSELGVRGHSREHPTVRLKNGSFESQPVVIDIDRQARRLRVFDPRSRKYIEDGGSLSWRISFNTTLRLRFTAKVALAAGYFTYGEAFRSGSRLDLLRALMNLDKHAMSNDLLVADHLDSPRSDQDRILRFVARSFGLSTVVVVPYAHGITFVVSCLRELMGLVHVPGETAGLPNDGGYEWGHVLACQGNRLQRGSFKRALELAARGIAATRPSTSDP